MSEIVIQLGAEFRSVAAGSTLADLVSDLGHAHAAVATGVNGDFVRRELRAATVLAEGDRVAVVKPIVGG